MDNLTRPEAGDRILQSWAKSVIDILRRRRLVPSEDFDIKTDSKGTTITFKVRKKQKRYKVRIVFSGGYISKAFAAEIMSPYAGTENESEVDVELRPLGWCDFVEFGGDSNHRTMAGELLDGGPYLKGEGTLAFNTTTIVDTEVEVEE